MRNISNCDGKVNSFHPTLYFYPILDTEDFGVSRTKIGLASTEPIHHIES